MSVEDVIRRHEEIRHAAPDNSKALQVAWVRRAQLKELRRAFKSGEVDPLVLLAGDGDPRIEEVIVHIRLKSYLPMIRGMGQSSTHTVLTAARMSGTHKIGQLSKKQREDLVWVIKGARGHSAI